MSDTHIDKYLKKILSTIVPLSPLQKYFKGERDLLADIEYKIILVMFSLVSFI